MCSDGAAHSCVYIPGRTGRHDNDANTYQGKALSNAFGNIEGYRLYRIRILPLFLTNYVGRRALACTATPGKKEEIVPYVKSNDLLPTVNQINDLLLRYVETTWQYVRGRNGNTS